MFKAQPPTKTTTWNETKQITSSPLQNRSHLFLFPISWKIVSQLCRKIRFFFYSNGKKQGFDFVCKQLRQDLYMSKTGSKLHHHHWDRSKIESRNQHLDHDRNFILEKKKTDTSRSLLTAGIIQNDGPWKRWLRDSKYGHFWYQFVRFLELNLP